MVWFGKTKPRFPVAYFVTAPIKLRINFCSPKLILKFDLGNSVFQQWFFSGRKWKNHNFQKMKEKSFLKWKILKISPAARKNSLFRRDFDSKPAQIRENHPWRMRKCSNFRKSKIKASLGKVRFFEEKNLQESTSRVLFSRFIPDVSKIQFLKISGHDFRGFWALKSFKNDSKWILGLF